MASKILLNAILTGEFKEFGGIDGKRDDDTLTDESDIDDEYGTDELEYTQEEENYLSNLNTDEKKHIDKLNTIPPFCT